MNFVVESHFHKEWQRN